MRPCRAALLLGIAAVVSSCGEDQAFRIDDRVDITAPGDRAVVELPVTLEWTARDLEDRSFAVYVDRAPVKPGAEVEVAVGDTDAVYLTSDNELVIDEVHDDQGDGRELHRATIVLVDPSGRRVGESAWEVTFEVEREEESP